MDGKSTLTIIYAFKRMKKYIHWIRSSVKNEFDLTEGSLLIYIFILSLYKMYEEYLFGDIVYTKQNIPF